MTQYKPLKHIPGEHVDMNTRTAVMAAENISYTSIRSKSGLRTTINSQFEGVYGVGEIVEEQRAGPEEPTSNSRQFR